MRSLDKLPKEFTREGEQPCQGVREASREGADARWPGGGGQVVGTKPMKRCIVSFDRTVGDVGK